MVVLLEQLTDVSDDELTKATKYVLQSCIHARGDYMLQFSHVAACTCISYFHTPERCKLIQILFVST